MSFLRLRRLNLSFIGAMLAVVTVLAASDSSGLQLQAVCGRESACLNVWGNLCNPHLCDQQSVASTCPTRVLLFGGLQTPKWHQSSGAWEGIRGLGCTSG
jgi:hypothetical protein